MNKNWEQTHTIKAGDVRPEVSVVPINIAHMLLEEAYKLGYKDAEKDVFDAFEHENKKLLDGFAHPNDCEMCMTVVK